jgi:YegS/Rv2252/BmrU family lipid kinase
MNLIKKNSSPKNSGLMLLYLFFVLLVTAVSVYANHLASLAVRAAEFNLEQRMLLVSRIGSGLASLAELNEFQKPEDMAKPRYQALKQKLSRFAAEHSLLNVCYIRLSSTKIQYIIDNNPDPKNQAGLNTPPRDKVLIPGLDSALAGGRAFPNLADYSRDRDGLPAASVLIFDENGRPAAVFRAEVQDRDIFLSRRVFQFITAVQLICGAAVFVIGMHAFWIFRNEAIRSKEQSREKTVLLTRAGAEISGGVREIMELSEIPPAEKLTSEAGSRLGMIQNSARGLLENLKDVLNFSRPEDESLRADETLEAGFPDSPDVFSEPPAAVPHTAGDTQAGSESRDRKHLFVINPISFGRRSDMEAVIADIHAAAADAGAEDYSIYVSNFPRAAISKIRDMADERGAKLFRIYAVGGDGILFDCLNGIIGLENAELAVIPYGNSNDFVRAFGENKEKYFRDIRMQLQSQTIPVDVIFCGHNYAINTCTIGLEAHTVHKAMEVNTRFAPFRSKYGPRLRKLFYNLTFYLCGLTAACTKRIISQNYTITIDGRDFSGDYAGINIANGPCYGGDKNAAIAALPDDGQMDVLLFKSDTSFNIIRIGSRYVTGKYHMFPDHISYKRGREIKVRSKDPLVMQLDGEVFLDTNITARIIPSAVRVVSPGGLSFLRRAEFHD